VNVALVANSLTELLAANTSAFHTTVFTDVRDVGSVVAGVDLPKQIVVTLERGPCAAIGGYASAIAATVVTLLKHRADDTTAVELVNVPAITDHPARRNAVFAAPLVTLVVASLQDVHRIVAGVDRDNVCTVTRDDGLERTIVGIVVIVAVVIFRIVGHRIGIVGRVIGVVVGAERIVGPRVVSPVGCGRIRAAVGVPSAGTTVVARQ
jgi:hypothetical protein